MWTGGWVRRFAAVSQRWQVRVATPDDADGLVELARAVAPYKVQPAAQVRHELAEPNARERKVTFVVAGDDGVLVGSATAGLAIWTSEPGASAANLRVHPDRRGRRIATALAEATEAHLTEIGARRVRVYCAEDSVGYAERHGFRPTGQMHYAGVDPRVLPPRPDVPAGIALLRLAEVEPALVFEADRVASLDEPGDMPADATTYDEWLHDMWEAPAHVRELGVAAVAGGEVAGFTAVEADRDRAFAGFTATVPAYRGRGLAKLVKSVSLRRAADAGITVAYTSNDGMNAPMLAVNDWLGYRRVATQVSCVRDDLGPD